MTSTPFLTTAISSVDGAAGVLRYRGVSLGDLVDACADEDFVFEPVKRFKLQAFRKSAAVAAGGPGPPRVRNRQAD